VLYFATNIITNTKQFPLPKDFFNPWGFFKATLFNYQTFFITSLDKNFFDN